MEHDCCSLSGSGGVWRAIVGVDSRLLTAACQPWSEMEVKLAACAASECFFVLFCFKAIVFSSLWLYYRLRTLLAHLVLHLPFTQSLISHWCCFIRVRSCFLRPNLFSHLSLGCIFTPSCLGLEQDKQNCRSSLVSHSANITKAQEEYMWRSSLFNWSADILK